MGNSFGDCGARSMSVFSSPGSSIKTAPIDGQKPGTSGLRKKTKDFMQEHYLENFVQATFNALRDENVPVSGGTLVVSGDGRYHNKTAIQRIIKMAVANGVATLWIGEGGLLSTPAVSAVIRSRPAALRPFGGFILTASHNPGGIDEDFGIKYNCENGGPAPENITNKIFEHTKAISEYRIADFPEIDLSKPNVLEVNGVAVHVFDATEDHVAVLKECFDFAAIKTFVSRPGFTACYDSMSGVQGPYAQRVLVEELGLPPSSLINEVPKEDFGGHNSPSHGHADPNLTHAVELVAAMGLNSRGKKVGRSGIGCAGGSNSDIPDFGAAADGDADRNMILGSQFFVSPSDSLAIIAANADCIPWFARAGGLKGCARSMPTSCALDKVAKAKGIAFFEVPTGWKFFGNLMDSGTGSFADKPSYTPFLCGEESFGTGSDHVREKDGMWALLAWLSILAAKNPDPDKPLVGVEQIAMEHWCTYGRNYYARYDFEGVDKDSANQMMDEMKDQTGQLKGKTFGQFTVAEADMFAYSDPVDGSLSENQGIRIIFTDDSRVVFRLSGTGVAGATIRLYLEKYAESTAKLNADPFEVVKPLADVAMEISQLPRKVNRTKPDVVT